MFSLCLDSESATTCGEATHIHKGQNRKSFTFLLNLVYRSWRLLKINRSSGNRTELFDSTVFRKIVSTYHTAYIIISQKDIVDGKADDGIVSH